MFVLFYFVLLPPDVAVYWDCHIYYNCRLLLLVNKHYVCLVCQQLLVCLEL